MARKRKKRQYRPRTQVLRQCKVCARWFFTTRTDTQFHDAGCRQAAYRYRKREKADKVAQKRRSRG